MKSITYFFCLVGLLVAGCSVSPSSGGLGNHPTWNRIPAWAQQRVQAAWWRNYGDSALNADISRAFAGNPDLAVIAARLDRAEAQVKQARAATLPHLNLGVGYRDGRRQNIDFGPYNLAPWEGGGQFSWEIDLTGKLLAATRSSRYARDAAFWDVHAARLQLAGRIASTRFLIYQLNGDISLVKESAAASAKLVSVVRSQSDAGIVSSIQLNEQQAKHEQTRRQVQELERLRQLAIVQLHTLIGSVSQNSSAQSSKSQLPHPRQTSRLSINQLLTSHPTLLAAEARVRSAFQMEKSAKLNLLPSFRLNASVIGAGHSLTGRYKTWQYRVGPSLDIPIYDPSRLAQIKVRQAECKLAAAKYQSAVIKVLNEIERAQINFLNRQRQLLSVQKEVASLKQAYDYSQSKFSAGVVSETDPLRAKQNWLMARQKQRALQYALLNDHISFIKATGGKNRNE